MLAADSRLHLHWQMLLLISGELKTEEDFRSGGEGRTHGVDAFLLCVSLASYSWTTTTTPAAVDVGSFLCERSASA
uniref:Uncharacterized protein n=1 Tax=Oryza punctata TaxID=4537 RepID=A0A1V1H3H6_ORYPU|nr:hypothetical protein [Oryza punctata]